MKKLLKILLSLIFSIILLFAFALPLNPAGNWYQQFMPNLGSQQINDIYFIDSLTGFAIASRNVNPDTASILRTTDGGDNWQIVFTQGSRRFSKIKFINNDIGFVCGGTGAGTPYLYKTTNSGINWTVISSSGCAFWNDMYVLSNDTIWVVDSDGLCGGVFRTTNGGGSWQQQLSLGSQNPSKIYMYNGRIGFFSSTAGLYKTTNSGMNWFIASNDFSFSDMFFTDSLTGWKASGFMKKTTNGGLNWVNQQLPIGNFVGNGANDFMNINSDTIWAVGESIIVSGSPPTRGVLFRTIDGGNNWLFQIPDTAIHINRYRLAQFVNKNYSWAYNFNGTGIHTTTGGDPVWYIGIQQISNNIPKDFELKQNYPNPFNPRTVIPYKLKNAAFVRLIAYDVTGRETQIMVNQHQQAGEYEVDFMGKFSASGIYFYRMEVTDDRSKQVYTETKKMILVK